MGGALFVLSLAVTAWWYAWPLGTTAPNGRVSPLASAALDVLIFSVFALHHSVFARAGVKGLLARVAPERLLRSIYVWVASLLLIALCALWQPIGGVVYRAPSWLAPLFALVQLFGVMLIVRSVRAIDPLELAGIRERPTSTALQITGPYHLVRHPLYLGWVLIVFAPWTLTADRLAFAAISSCYLMMAIPWEERSLELAFGEAYATYKRQVRWRVIPYVY
jgi:protein-S-isoprenylcysteine O-methyltransferase Ste14